MKSNLWIRKALAVCLVVAVNVTYSMVAMANSAKIAGELTVSGKSVNGETPVVTVNGEPAKSGRSIFSASTISTPQDASASINLGKSGRINLAPGTSVILTFNDKAISGDISSGRITVSGNSEAAVFRTAAGETVRLNAGESVAATGATQDTDDDDEGGAAWWLWALVFGGAAAGILIAATQGDNRTDLGGGGTVVSPTR
ncbi:MAG: hypothetical protein WBD22_01050 [Pyrinomonadaceae bacterium]